MQDLAKAPPASTALEHADDDGEADFEDFQMISNDSSSSESLYYSFEEHVQFLVGKFSEKFNDWKNSFNRNNRGP